MLDRLFGRILNNAGNAIGNAVGESVGNVIEGVTSQAAQGITNEMAAKNEARQNELRADNQAQADAMQREHEQANVNHELAMKEQRMISELPAHCPHCNAPTSKSINCEFCGCKIVE